MPSAQNMLTGSKRQNRARGYQKRGLSSQIFKAYISLWNWLIQDKKSANRALPPEFCQVLPDFMEFGRQLPGWQNGRLLPTTLIPPMFQFLCIAGLAALQMGSFHEVVANPKPQSGSVRFETRDITSFMTTQVTLQNAADIFAFTVYEGTGTYEPNITSGAILLGDMKACGDAFDTSLIQLFTLPRLAPGSSLLTPSEAETVNASISSTQAFILNKFNDLLNNFGFYSDVENSAYLTTMLCHWGYILSEENNVFLAQLVLAAPSEEYASSWSSLQANSALGYQYFLEQSPYGGFC
ncbi:hypothetical protein B0H11DRAFT_1920374 [Mycena galericulata]|nr:hypothetical protein B0H11DRAFT_1920374 [Mycena galericulata]